MTVRHRDRQTGRVTESPGIRAAGRAGIFAEWTDEAERWLFITPHDDDVVIGGGMLLAAARAAGVEAQVCVVTDGRMGYCRTEQAADIVAVRAAEMRTAVQRLGGAPVARLEYPDCDLERHTGRRAVAGGEPGRGEPHAGGAASGLETPDVRAGHTGLQNSFTALLREVRPTRVVLPTEADYHPDHKIVHRELLISLFHAAGAVWPELGEPLAAVPHLYELAIYNDFPSPPNLQIEGSEKDFAAKLEAIAAFASQEQITAVVEGVRSGGPYEYVRELPFTFYDPARYAELFSEGGRA